MLVRLVATTYAIAALAACAGTDPAAEELPLGRATQAITGGNLVPPSWEDDNHYAATLVYEIENSGAACSGVRISARRILTAAHCVPKNSAGDFIRMRNSLGGFDDGPLAFGTLAAVYRHPAFDAMHRFNLGNFTLENNAATTYGYDAAILELENSNAFNFNGGGSIPSLNTSPDIDGSRVEAFDWVRLVSYGCDSGSNNGKKQWADFEAYTRSSLPPGETGWSWAVSAIPLEWDRMYAHDFVSMTPGVQGCPSDSGGPAFRMTPGGWQVAGIASAIESAVDDNNRTFFTRTANLKRWISNPDRTNQFVHGRVGYLLSAQNAMCAAPANSSNNGPVNEYYCDTRDQFGDQYFEWKLLAKSNGYWSFRNEFTDKCLSTKNGEPAQYTCTGSDAQQWRPEIVSGRQVLVNRHWDECLRAASADPGDRLELGGCGASFAEYSFHP